MSSYTECYRITLRSYNNKCEKFQTQNLKIILGNQSYWYLTVINKIVVDN